MSVRGADLVAKNIIRYGGRFLETVNKTMKKVSLVMDNQVTKNISLRDHSLEELRMLGHPYAKRHGEKGIPLHNPYWQIHERTGKLMDSKESGTTKASILLGNLSASAFVGFDEKKAEHAKYIVWGTSKMIPRPVLIGSVNQIKDKAFKVIKGDLGALTVGFVAR